MPRFLSDDSCYAFSRAISTFSPEEAEESDLCLFPPFRAVRLEHLSLNIHDLDVFLNVVDTFSDARSQTRDQKFTVNSQERQAHTHG